jgi:hypothetical protein
MTLAINSGIETLAAVSEAEAAVFQQVVDGVLSNEVVLYTGEPLSDADALRRAEIIDVRQPRAVDRRRRALHSVGAALLGEVNWEPRRTSSEQSDEQV